MSCALPLARTLLSCAFPAAVCIAYTISTSIYMNIFVYKLLNCTSESCHLVVLAIIIIIIIGGRSGETGNERTTAAPLKAAGDPPKRKML